LTKNRLLVLITYHELEDNRSQTVKRARRLLEEARVCFGVKSKRYLELSDRVAEIEQKWGEEHPPGWDY
jgi:hypothetical protein